MIEELRKLEIPHLIETAEWHYVDIDYHPPRVERMWTALDNGMRLNLHRIHPVQSGSALWHYHPWPSAMHVLSGRYEMGLGYLPSPENEVVPIGVIELGPDTYYSMTNPNGAHYVDPLDDIPTLSVMLTGVPWKTDHSHDRFGKGLAKALNDEDAKKLKHDFENFYRIRRAYGSLFEDK